MALSAATNFQMLSSSFSLVRLQSRWIQQRYQTLHDCQVLQHMIDVLNFPYSLCGSSKVYLLK